MKKVSPDNCHRSLSNRGITRRDKVSDVWLMSRWYDGYQSESYMGNVVQKSIFSNGQFLCGLTARRKGITSTGTIIS